MPPAAALPADCLCCSRARPREGYCTHARLPPARMRACPPQAEAREGHWKGVSPLWNDVLARHETPGAAMHIMVGGGDQLYCDDVWQVSPVALRPQCRCTDGFSGQPRTRRAPLLQAAQPLPSGRPCVWGCQPSAVVSPPCAGACSNSTTRMHGRGVRRLMVQPHRGLRWQGTGRSLAGHRKAALLPCCLHVGIRPDAAFAPVCVCAQCPALKAFLDLPNTVSSCCASSCQWASLRAFWRTGALQYAVGVGPWGAQPLHAHAFGDWHVHRYVRVSVNCGNGQLGDSSRLCAMLMLRAEPGTASTLLTRGAPAGPCCAAAGRTAAGGQAGLCVHAADAAGGGRLLFPPLLHALFAKRHRGGLRPHPAGEAHLGVT
jgi:hypothetical protein